MFSSASAREGYVDVTQDYILYSVPWHAAYHYAPAVEFIADDIRPDISDCNMAKHSSTLRAAYPSPVLIIQKGITVFLVIVAYASATDPDEKRTLDISHWLRIEAFLLAGHTAIEGPGPAKRYKDRLLEFAGSSRAAFEGCLTLIVKRDMARRLAYEEGGHLRGKDGLVKFYTDSRDNDERHEETEATPGALIPADYAEPATEADKHKLDLIARKTVLKFTRSLSKDERVILVFDLLNISQRVAIENKLIKVQKTSASEKLQAVRRRIASLKWPFKPDPAEETLLFRAFASELVDWAQGPENADLACYIAQAEAAP